MSDDFDLDDFDGAGLLDDPTMRGNANLDVQDYQRYPDAEDSSLLSDEIQEDVDSRPGRGAAPAFDVDGMERADLTDDDGEQDEPSYPWGPGSGGGYRPHSMNTDLSGADGQTPAQEVAIRVRDSAQPVRQAQQQQQNMQASNVGVDPLTVYDRESFERDDSPGDVIGTGIFGMDENVAWRTQDGSFENNYAMPAYVATDPELGTQQSEMWDSTANQWRVTQPSGGGVTFATRTAGLAPIPVGGQMPEMRPERTGPRSHIEAFGRAAAKAVVDESRLYQNTAQRSAFLTSAIESLGTGQAARCRQVADRLVAMGYRSDNALEDSLAHCVMHATMKDLGDRARGKNGLPRVDRMGSGVRQNAGAIQQAVAAHIAPLAVDKGRQQADVAALVSSPAAAGMGQVATPEASAPSTTGRNLLVGVAVIGAGYYFLTQTRQGRTVQRNVKRHARRFARKIGVK